jgi:dTDP-4-amino-4,6-dideoxygalactose transaminase
VKLRHLDAWHEGRRKNAADYRRLFGAQKLPGGTVTLPLERPGAFHIYNQFILRVPAAKRDALVKHLQTNGIGCEIYYPVPCHLQECFASEGHKAGDYPQSERAAKETIAVPIYPELTDEQKACVVETVAEFLKA